MKTVLIRSSIVVALLAGCAGQEGESEPTSTTADEAAETTTSTTEAKAGTSLVPDTTDAPREVYLSEDLIDQVAMLASDEAGVPAGDLEVEVAMEVTWSDGSLGCPQPGQFYTQALVDGYWVVFTHDGETYDYRSSLDADFRRCVDGAPPASIYEDR